MIMYLFILFLNSLYFDVIEIHTHWEARDEWASGHSNWTRANGYMIGNGAQCTLTANSHTRVPTLVPQASLIPVAVAVQHALGSTTEVRIALVLWQALASAIQATSVGCALLAWVFGQQRFS